jgi:hypothetical protein
MAAVFRATGPRQFPLRPYTSSRKLMEKQPSSVLGRVAVGLATLLMFGAAIGMFVF